MGCLLRFLASGLLLLGIDWIFDGISIDGFGTALLAVIVLGILNFFIKPILNLISLPITILTFGLFSFIITALVFYLAAQFVSGFHITSFMSALFGSIIYSLGQSLLFSD